MIVEIILLLLLDGAHAQQVCCKVGVIEGLYKLGDTVCLGAKVQACQDLKVAVDLLDELEKLMHEHLIGLLEGVGDVVLHLFTGIGPEHHQHVEGDATEK